MMFAGRKEGEAPGRTRGRQGGEGSGFSTPHASLLQAEGQATNERGSSLRGPPWGALGACWAQFNLHWRGPSRQWGGRGVHLTRCPVPSIYRHCKGYGEMFQGSPLGLDSGYPTF